MIGFLLHHGLCYYYLKTNNTKNVLPTIQKISQYMSCAIYIVLAFVFFHFGIYSILILSIGAFESLAMCMLPILKTSAAFELIRIDSANNGWNMDNNGYITRQT
jgi:hypothetical protein